MFKCEFCNREFEKSTALAGHISHCKENPNKKRTKEDYIKWNNIGTKSYIESRSKYRQLYPEKYLIQEYKCNCEKCGKEYIVNVTQEQFEKGKYKKNCSRSCANGHIVSEETKKKISNGVKNSEIFKINNAKYNILKIYKCKVCGKEFTVKDIRNVGGKQYCSLECKHKYLSEHTGGYRKGSGHGKSGWYKGIHCDSTWELAFLIYHLDNNLKIERCKEQRKYIFNGIEHTYFPDFITDKGIIEIKGYSTPQWEAKQEQNKDVITLYKKDIQPYIDYAKQKYGNDLEILYDGINPKKILNLENHWKIWVHNDNEQLFINPELYDEYISKGYVHGRFSNKQK